MRNFQLIILSTDPTFLTWDTKHAKLQTIKSAFERARNAELDIQTRYKGVVPEVVGGRITREWFDSISVPLYLEGYDFVGLHLSERQKQAWGIKPGLRGSTFVDGDESGEFYFWADESTKRGKGPFNQFEETCMHELRHEVCTGTNSYDDTHAIHSDQRSLAYGFIRFDMSQYRRRSRMQLQIIHILQKTIAMLKILKAAQTTLLHPVEGFRALISQEYGAPNNTWYPTTGHHIGTDYAVPNNTPVLAPFDGEVIASGTSPSLGNYCFYQYTFNGHIYVERWLHLRYVPKLGQYRRGALVCHTGDTGMSTGPHLHQEIWRDEVRLDLINNQNWATLTVNPQQHYAK